MCKAKSIGTVMRRIAIDKALREKDPRYLLLIFSDLFREHITFCRLAGLMVSDSDVNDILLMELRA